MEAAKKILGQLNEIVLGKPRQTELAVACLIAGCHFIIEDRPGVGKTTFIRALGQLCGFQINRIQFTNDLLPSDILGSSIFDPDKRDFEFKKGPIFAQYVIADEINRGGAKTQSAFLQAMEERTVHVDGASYILPQPFFVVATQNPIDLSGTFPLPDSQLDRFSAVIKMGYPDPKNEKLLIQSPKTLHQIKPVCSPQEIVDLGAQLKTIEAEPSLIDYVYRLVEQTRTHPHCEGLSTRGAQSLFQIGKAMALLSGRNYVIPEDIQKGFVDSTSHRIYVRNGDSRGIAEQILSQTSV